MVVTMASVGIVLALLMLALNIASYARMTGNADRTLSILIENDGDFPAYMKEPMQRSQNDVRDDVPAPPRRPDGQDGLQSEYMGMSPEAPFESRYFSVTLTEDGEPGTVNISAIASVSSEMAAGYAKNALESGSEAGFIGNYRYRCGDSLVVFLDCTRDLDTFRSSLVISLAVAGIGLVCVFLLSLVLSSIAVKPIEDSYAKQKRFITDASHEIRTPLTIIDASTEVLEMTNGANEWTSSIRSQISRLSDLTKSLLALARMDEGRAKSQFSDFSLSDAVSETAESFESVAITGGKSLEPAVEKGLSFHGDEKQIRQLVSILLDNALKYSNPEGWIKVRLGKKGKKCLLEVSNSADGMEKGEHPRVFDRFMRIDQARATAIPGYGLGLSLAQSIVNAHKGRISAFSRDAGSFTVSVVL